MWNKKSEETPQPAATPTPRPTAEPRRSGNTRALIGESVRVEGTISGDEDLFIEGEVEGTVKLHDNAVTVGRGGRVKADIHGRMLVVEGKVQGDLFAGEQAVVRASGEVRGNITSPRVTLEDGAKFKGSIDMEPKRPAGGASKGASEAEAKGPSGAEAKGPSGRDDGKGDPGKAAAPAGGPGGAGGGEGKGSGEKGGGGAATGQPPGRDEGQGPGKGSSG